jgi:uncharacterized protein (UPF0305 family)
MKYLEWNLDDMTENTDLYDPFGNLSIRGDTGIIEENDTYIDAFFEAFVEGIERMKQQNIVTVDPLVEPNDIVFNHENNTLTIEYGNQKAIIYDKLQFIKEVQESVNRLVTILDNFADSSKQKKRELIKLRNFIPS